MRVTKMVLKLVNIGIIWALDRWQAMPSHVFQVWAHVMPINQEMHHILGSESQPQWFAIAVVLLTEVKNQKKFRR